MSRLDSRALIGTVTICALLKQQMLHPCPRDYFHYATKMLPFNY